MNCEKGKHKNTDVFYSIKKMNNLIVNLMNDEFRKFDLTESQARTLFFLNKNMTENIMQKDLEEYFGTSHATVNGIIGRLEQKGYVTYKQSLEDKRAKLISITTTGQNIMKQINEVRVEQVKYLSEVLSNEETSNLTFMLTKLINKLEEKKYKGDN